jgi:hypothetical protein
LACQFLHHISQKPATNFNCNALSQIVLKYHLSYCSVSTPILPANNSKFCSKSYELLQQITQIVTNHAHCRIKSHTLPLHKLHALIMNKSRKLLQRFLSLLNSANFCSCDKSCLTAQIIVTNNSHCYEYSVLKDNGGQIYECLCVPCL